MPNNQEVKYDWIEEDEENPGESLPRKKINKLKLALGITAGIVLAGLIIGVAIYFGLPAIVGAALLKVATAAALAAKTFFAGFSFSAFASSAWASVTGFVANNVAATVGMVFGALLGIGIIAEIASIISKKKHYNGISTSEINRMNRYKRNTESEFTHARQQRPSPYAVAESALAQFASDARKAYHRFVNRTFFAPKQGDGVRVVDVKTVEELQRPPKP